MVCRLFDDGHAGWFKVIPDYGFDLHEIISFFLKKGCFLQVGR